jgi:ribosomal protein S18 acetylase RimI-like enzyme
VLGSAGLGPHWEPERADTVTLFGMYVAPRGRGRGVGEALVRAVLEEARRRERPEVILEVASNNAPAIALYERCGFVRTGMTHPHPRDETIHEVEMRAELGESGASAPS